MSQTHDQQRFTISEVAADWHEPMVPQRITGPSMPALTDNWTNALYKFTVIIIINWTHGAASRHSIVLTSKVSSNSNKK